MERRERVIVGLLAVVGVALGAIREFVFINLNYQVDHVARGTAYSYAHSLVRHWTAGLDLGALLLLKWTAAILFVVLGACGAWAMLRVLGGNRTQGCWLLMAYAGLTVLALLLHMVGGTAAPSAGVQLLHMLQYPLPMYALLLLRPLYVRSGRD